MWLVATTKRLLDTVADDARTDHEAKRLNVGTTPMEQELSSSSGVKRSNLEPIRRADTEAEKALKRARLLQPNEPRQHRKVAEEAFLAETRETVDVLTVSALRQAHEMIHRDEVTAESFYQAHKHMTVTTKEQAR